MEFSEVIKKRRSIRSYQKQALPNPLLMEILEAGRLAQSAHNRQPWRFIVIRDEENKKRLARICPGNEWLTDVSVIIAGVATDVEYRMGCGRPADDIDISIALTHISLAATDKGLGSCWIGSFDYDKTTEILGIPEKYILVSMLALGYPAGIPAPTSRRPLEDLIMYECWSE